MYVRYCIVLSCQIKLILFSGWHRSKWRILRPIAMKGNEKIHLTFCVFVYMISAAPLSSAVKIFTGDHHTNLNFGSRSYWVHRISSGNILFILHVLFYIMLCYVIICHCLHLFILLDIFLIYTLMLWVQACSYGSIFNTIFYLSLPALVFTTFRKYACS